MDSTDDRLADFLNEEPIVFMNCTNTEMLFSVGLAFAVSIVPSIILGIILGNAMVSLIIMLILTVVGSWLLMNRLSSIRDKHHATWFEERLLQFKVRHGLGGSPLILESNRYRRGRRYG